MQRLTEQKVYAEGQDVSRLCSLRDDDDYEKNAFQLQS